MGSRYKVSIPHPFLRPVQLVVRFWPNECLTIELTALDHCALCPYTGQKDCCDQNYYWMYVLKWKKRGCMKQYRGLTSIPVYIRFSEQSLINGPQFYSDWSYKIWLCFSDLSSSTYVLPKNILWIWKFYAGINVVIVHIYQKSRTFFCHK